MILAPRSTPAEEVPHNVLRYLQTLAQPGMALGSLNWERVPEGFAQPPGGYLFYFRLRFRPDGETRWLDFIHATADRSLEPANGLGDLRRAVYDAKGRRVQIAEGSPETDDIFDGKPNANP